MTRPTMQATMMATAQLMAERSTCSRLQVGCVITDSIMTAIYSIGYNGNYRGGPHACDRPDEGNCGCLHAEDNALVKLRTEQEQLLLFTTHSPCSACAKRIVNQGNIVVVWYDAAYRDDAGLTILKAGGVEVRVLGSGTGIQVEARLCLHCRTKYIADLDPGTCPSCGSTFYEPVVESDYHAALDHQVVLREEKEND